VTDHPDYAAEELEALVSILRDTGWALRVVSDIYQPAGMALVLEGDRSGHDIIAHAPSVPALLKQLVERTLAGERL
jgi:hypothetical protein